MVTLRLFGMNGISIGKFQPLPKVAELTVMLRNVTVNNMGVSKMDYFMEWSEWLAIVDKFPKDDKIAFDKIEMELEEEDV
tara:strand:- start:161 stop:400 length:240 start_codon:yes stop_codon:yes gene_type:complete